LGLVNEVVQPEDLAERVQALAQALCSNSPESLRATKQLMAAQNKAWLDAAIEAAMEANAEARQTADFREGIAAFLEKRKAVWSK
jgi:methylglutaconyl-CoA hydratase